MPTKDGRIVAAENQVRVLRALYRFGWLRTRDLAALLWQSWTKKPGDNPSYQPVAPTASGLRMAQRTLRRLLEGRQVLRAQAPDGSLIYALAEAGARRLQQHGVSASSGKDLVRSFSVAHYQHRAIANKIAIQGIVEGFHVSTEREIARGRWLGGEGGIAGKKPDVLVHAGGNIWWVEVEKSRKNTKDYTRLLQWLASVRQDVKRPAGSALLGGGRHWRKVVFVCSLAFQEKLRRDLASAGWSKEFIAELLSFEVLRAIPHGGNINFQERHP